MTFITIIRRRTLLVLLLLLATASTKIVQAKVSTSNNGVSSSSFRASGRNLQDEGNKLEVAFDEDSEKDDSDTNTNTNDNNYVPHPDGTAVRYQDQDGTWMYGIIEKYDNSTQTYTIRWDEDNMEEEFSNLNKVDGLVGNAEKKVAENEQQDDNEDENYDWNNDEEEGDIPINTREQQEDNSDYNKSGTAYQGDVPNSFDFQYAYKYEDLSDYEPWPVGTDTLLEFTDGWYEGQIASFSLSDDKKNATYVVTWSDGSTDSFVNELEWMDLMVANSLDYEPWQIGTPVFGYPNPDSVDAADGQESENAYLNGEITAFEDRAYAVTWSNGDVVVYNDFDVVDELVSNAGAYLNPSFMENYNPWPKDTPVSWDFDDGWWDGTIADYSNGTYEVTWSDGSSKYYSNLEKIDQMVAFASGQGFIGNLADPSTQNDDYQYDADNIYGDYYRLETLVYAEFKDGWWAGYIDSYEGEYYVVRWNDNSVDTFLPSEDFDQMVINGQSIPLDYDVYPVGTHVYSNFEGAWFWGTVEYSEGGFYTILWDDGQRTTYVSGPEIDEMVANAYKGGMTTFGKLALTLFVLGGLGGIIFFVWRRNDRKQQLANVEEQVRENELDLTDGNETEYSDHPAERTKPALV